MYSGGDKGVGMIFAVMLAMPAKVVVCVWVMVCA